MRTQRVVIVGGGISGLSVAWWLHRAGCDVTVLEGEAKPGGTMLTVREDGWLIEKGPTSALETTPLFNQMFEELGILGQRVYANEASNKRYILRAGHLHALPMSPGAFLKSALWSFSGKMRLLKEPFIGRAKQEETIAEFVERRLGREFLEYAINPFVAGVYAGNPEQLSVRAAFPKLYALESTYGGLIKGMIRGRKERKKRVEKAKDRSRMFSFVDGMETFPAAMSKSLADRIKCNATVVEITKRNDDGTQAGFSVTYRVAGREDVTVADAVVLSTPAHVAGQLLRRFSPDLASMLQGIPYPPVAEVFFGFRREQVRRALDGFGYLIPAKEGRRILGTIWSSTIFPGRAPAGHVALTTFVGGSRQPELALLDEANLSKLVLGDLSDIIGVSGPPVKSMIVKWEKAIPQYHLGHLDIMQRVEALEEQFAGLFLCSNFRGGIAVGDCVMNAKRVADRVIQQVHLSDSAHTVEVPAGVKIS